MAKCKTCGEKMSFFEGITSSFKCKDCLKKEEEKARKESKKQALFEKQRKEKKKKRIQEKKQKELQKKKEAEEKARKEAEKQAFHLSHSLHLHWGNVCATHGEYLKMISLLQTQMNYVG